jgi:hypothetical protein
MSIWNAYVSPSQERWPVIRHALVGFRALDARRGSSAR